MMLKPLPITLSALLILGGGTAFAAEQSLPNEALYPVKVQVNERVRATFTPTAEAKAKWEARVAVRRLEEAEELAIKNKLNAETQTTIETNFDVQAKLVQEKIAKLKAEGNTQAAIDLSNSFQAALHAHETILIQLDAQNIDETAIDPMIEKVKLNAASILEGAKDFQSDTTVDVQAELKLTAQKKQRSASEAIAVAKQRVSASTNINADIKAKASLLVQMANAELDAGNTTYNQANFKEALMHYESAEMQADEVVIMLKVSQTLRLEVFPEIPSPELPIKSELKPEPKDTVNFDTKVEIDTKVDTSIKIDAAIKEDPIIELKPSTILENKTQLKAGL